MSAKRSYKINSQELWITVNDENSVSPATIGLFIECFMKPFADKTGTDLWWNVMEFQGDHFIFYFPKVHSLGNSQILFDQLLANPDRYEKLRHLVVKTSDQLSKTSSAIIKKKHAKLSSTEIGRLFSRLRRDFTRHGVYGFISTLIDIPHVHYTNKTLEIISVAKKRSRAPRQVSDYFDILSSIPEQSFAKQEELALLEILKKIIRQRRLVKLFTTKSTGELADALAKDPVGKMIRRHQQKYIWAYFGYMGPAMTEEYIIDNLKTLLREKAAPAKIIAKHRRHIRQINANIKRAEHELQLTSFEKSFLRSLRNTIFMKLYRKDAETFSFYAESFLLKELAKRHALSLAEIHKLAPWEFVAAARGDKKLLSSLKDRKKYCVIASLSLDSKILTGERAKKFIKNLNLGENVKNVKEFSGQIACGGKAQGQIKIIHQPGEMAKMNKGDILVASATTPDIMPAMKQAAAIVTDQGGITCHAAIVSRELSIPCVIGTKIATKVLKDGDKVEVNANEGLIKKLTSS